jgi:hypothetical protein
MRSQRGIFWSRELGVLKASSRNPPSPKEQQALWLVVASQLQRHQGGAQQSRRNDQLTKQ